MTCLIVYIARLSVSFRTRSLIICLCLVAGHEFHEIKERAFVHHFLNPAGEPKGKDKCGMMGESRNKRRFSGPLAWVVVLGLALAYRTVIERQVARREKPRESDIFVVSYPKSGELGQSLQQWNASHT